MKKYLLVLLVFVACSDEELTSVYTIPAGEHYSYPRDTATLDKKPLQFYAMIGSSALNCQSEDINKLYGFSDCNDLHHENSARFGWVSDGKQLHIYAYTYCDGKRFYKYIQPIHADSWYDFKIEIYKGSYKFSVTKFGATRQVYMARCAKCNNGVYYMLYPYYGGNNTCDSDISVAIRQY